MHAIKKEGRKDDRKVGSMFVSSCVAEQATVHYGIKCVFARQILSLVTIKLFANIFFGLGVGDGRTIVGTYFSIFLCDTAPTLN